MKRQETAISRMLHFLEKKKPIIIAIIFLLILPFNASTTYAQKIVIKAPAETANSKIGDLYYGMHTDGWICGQDGEKVYFTIAQYLRRINEVEKVFSMLNNRLEKQYGELKNALKPPMTFTGITQKGMVEFFKNALSGYPETLTGYKLELINLEKELKKRLNEGIDKFFDIDFGLKDVGTKVKRESYDEVGGKIQFTYTLSDCYTKNEVDTMLKTLKKSLDSAIKARDELQKTINKVYAGKDTYFDLTK